MPAADAPARAEATLSKRGPISQVCSAGRVRCPWPLWNTGAVQIVILAGGVGGSRFVSGAQEAFPDADISVIVYTADDVTLHGLRICPDLDTVM